MIAEKGCQSLESLLTMRISRSTVILGTPGCGVYKSSARAGWHARSAAAVDGCSPASWKSM